MPDTDILTPQEKEFLKAKEAQEKSRKKHQSKLNKLQEGFEINCRHARYTEYPWEHDNGYGHQTKMTGWRCNFCNKVNPYKSPTTPWYHPSYE